MIMQDIAIQIVNGQHGATREDIVEAYQFIVDNGLTHLLNDEQYAFCNLLIENCEVMTIPWSAYNSSL